MKTMDIVCGILHDERGYLIAKRGKGIHENIWEFPGGKVEEGESKEEAIIRELKEELDLTCEVERYLTCVKDVREDCILHVYAYLCRIREGTLSLQAHHEAKWVSLDELSTYAFEPADTPIRNALAALNMKKI